MAAIPFLPAELKLFVKFLNGNQAELTVSNTDTVLSVKQRLHETEGIPPEHQVLTNPASGSVMGDERQLGSFSTLQTGATISCVIKAP